MESPELYNKISKLPEVQELLSELFEFSLIEPTTNIKDYSIKSREPLLVISENDSGGIFCLSGSNSIDEKEMIFISSEGEAGKIGENFKEGLRLIICLPFWLDLLKFSGGGDLDEMNKAFPFVKSELEEFIPGMNEVRSEILEIMGLEEVINPVEKLHSTVSSGMKTIIYSDDGTEYDLLFNTFKASDNPNWKK